MYKGLRAREGKRFSLTSPSLFSLRALTPFWDGSMCDPKCEGSVRDIYSPSRPSNALYIMVCGLWCEKVRVKSEFFFLVYMHYGNTLAIVFSPTYSYYESDAFGLTVRNVRTLSPSLRTEICVTICIFQQQCHLVEDIAGACLLSFRSAKDRD